MQLSQVTILNSVKFENGNQFEVGTEYFDYDGMICNSIQEIPEEDRMEDEVISVSFGDQYDGMTVYFNEKGEEVFI